MTVIVCVDDYLGVSFEGRRQSRDRMLRSYLLDLVGGAALRMNPYSARQFEEDISHAAVSENFLSEAKRGDFCFAEGEALAPYSEKISRVVLCWWNRIYPSDKTLDFIPWEHGMELSDTAELRGSSHERLTVEIWERI